MSFWSKLRGLFQTESHESEPEDTTLLHDLDQRMRKLQKRERRQAQLLEHMYQDLGAKLDTVQSRLQSELPLETVTACAESLALYRQHREQDQALEHVWSRCTAMLEAFGIQLILDHGQPFDDTRHQACDTRWDPQKPANTVLEVVRPGVIVRDRISRPAVVVINSQAASEDQTASAS